MSNRETKSAIIITPRQKQKPTTLKDFIGSNKIREIFSVCQDKLVDSKIIYLLVLVYERQAGNYFSTLWQYAFAFAG
jgi:hypothetical protein